MKKTILALVLVLAGMAQAAPFDDALAAAQRRDYATAFRGFRTLALNGYTSAQYNLNLMYDNGHGVPKDYQQAVVWRRKAAAQGDAIAQNGLGGMYSEGRGVPKDYQQAYFWWLLASVGGDAGPIANRDRVEAMLTPEQRATAQARARDWKPR